MKVNVFQGRVSQTIDLKEVFGVSFKKSSSMRETVAQKLIDKMKSRISNGVDRYGEEMAPYSEVYQKSFDYIAARKDGTVNMKLTGDMLGSVDVLQSNGDKITIGFVSSEENLKAYNHEMGAGSLPVRQFFGITESDVDEIKQELAQELQILKEMKGTQFTDENAKSYTTLEQLRGAVEGGSFTNSFIKSEVKE